MVILCDQLQEPFINTEKMLLLSYVSLLAVERSLERPKEDLVCSIYLYGRLSQLNAEPVIVFEVQFSLLIQHYCI